MRRRGCEGQASVEALALVPVLVGAVVLVWQLAVIGVAALQVHEQVRVRAVSAAPTGSGRVSADVTAPALLPGLGRLRLRAGAEIYVP